MLYLKAAFAFVGLGLVAQIDYQGTITLGTVIVSALVIVAAGVFTIKAQTASTWRTEAEGQRTHADRMTEEKQALEIAHSHEMATQTREQQELRHGLKDELATVRAQLEVERSKHDISKIDATQGLLLESMERQESILGEIRDALASTAGTREPPSAVPPDQPAAS